MLSQPLPPNSITKFVYGPLFVQCYFFEIHNWVFLFKIKFLGGDNDDIDGMTTMFHITKSVAQKLKTLFAFICETLVQKTTSILNNYSKDEFAKVKDLDANSETKVVNLLSHMLDALTVVFTHNQVCPKSIFLWPKQRK